MDEQYPQGTFIAHDEPTLPLPDVPADAPPEPVPDLPEETVKVSVQRTPTDELLARLRHIEELLEELRRTVIATVREHRHQEFSLARLLGSILQALVAGLLLWALTDWVFGEPRDVLLTKLAFAAVLQLAALTGFVLGREVD